MYPVSYTHLDVYKRQARESGVVPSVQCGLLWDWADAGYWVRRSPLKTSVWHR